jgi:hypothetical protein
MPSMAFLKKSIMSCQSIRNGEKFFRPAMSAAAMGISVPISGHATYGTVLPLARRKNSSNVTCNLHSLLYVHRWCIMPIRPQEKNSTACAVVILMQMRATVTCGAGYIGRYAGSPGIG